MKIVITIDDESIKIDDKRDLGGIKKKLKKGNVGAVKKLSNPDKKKKGTPIEDEEKEMAKTLKKMGVKPKK